MIGHLVKKLRRKALYAGLDDFFDEQIERIRQQTENHSDGSHTDIYGWMGRPELHPDLYAIEVRS